jgi:hypothetical protein
VTQNSFPPTVHLYNLRHLGAGNPEAACMGEQRGGRFGTIDMLFLTGARSVGTRAAAALMQQARRSQVKP